MKTKCMSCGGSMKKMSKGGVTLSKAQKGKTVTPFQNYMKVSGAMASDTSDVFTGNRNGLNPKLDKAYYDTYYAGRENERRKGADAIKYDTQGNRIGKQTVHKIGGAKMQKGGSIKKSTSGMYGIPQENLGTSGQYGFAKKGGTHKMPNGKMMLNSKMQKGGTTKADPYGVSLLNENYKIKGKNKSGGKTPMGPTKIVPKKVDPKAPPKASKTRTIERNGTFEMKKGGATKAIKFAALAPPYNKATFADRIAGAKKKK